LKSAAREAQTANQRSSRQPGADDMPSASNAASSPIEADVIESVAGRVRSRDSLRMPSEASLGAEAI
jgi:hypothetical protein